jgi:enamine deaminase RidA (YjgF/YER057c/UK114 family)
MSIALCSDMLCKMTTNMRMVITALLGGALLGNVSGAENRTGKQFLNVDGHQPPGYTQVVTASPGEVIFISGRGGAAANGTLPADFETQAKNTFEDLKKCLALAGASFSDVVKVNYYVTDLANTGKLRVVRAKYLNMKQPPAATLVQVGLGGGALIEIEATAVVPQ